MPNLDIRAEQCCQSQDTRGSKMTICIAAACDGGKHIVVATDRMVTAGPPLNLEFEPPLTKIECLGKGCIALAAGSLPFADQIISEAKGKVGVTQPPPVDAVCQLVQQSYMAFRNHLIDDQVILATLGQDFKKFRDNAGTLPQYLHQQPNVYQLLFSQSQQYNLGLELLIAGIDASGAHISVIIHPGALVCLNKLGYAAIGSGAIHALSVFHLGGQSAQLPLAQTLLSVYGVKRAAEVAPGVGTETDMAVVSADATWTCTKPLLDEVQEAHEQCVKKAKPQCEGIEKTYDAEHGKAS